MYKRQLLSGATLVVKRIPGVKRAALAPILPNADKGVMLIDCGANVECTPPVSYTHLDTSAALGALRGGGKVLGVLGCGLDTVYPCLLYTSLDLYGFTGDVYAVDRELLEYMSPVKAPQKVLFTCSIRPVPEKRAEKTRYVLLEGVQDPGNLGTIIRTANALNYGKVLLLPGCADRYNPCLLYTSSLSPVMCINPSYPTTDVV